MFRLGLFLISLFFVIICDAQVTITTVGQKTIVRGSSIKAGQSRANGVPYSPVATDTVIFKGYYEIVLGADSTSTSNNQFYASGYGAGGGYFHAYLTPPPAYAELKKQLDGSYIETNDKMLLFKYGEKYVDGALSYQIYDYLRTPLIAKPITIPALMLNKVVGDNYLAVDLSKITGLTGSNENTYYYTLEVLNDKNEKFLLRFKYVPTNN